MRDERNASKPTPLAIFVRRRLEELELKQSDFCRLTGFDQGLLSKIQNSIITSLSLESTLRLALGLSISPKVLFGLMDRFDLQDLVEGVRRGGFGEDGGRHGTPQCGGAQPSTRRARSTWKRVDSSRSSTWIRSLALW